MEPVKDFTAQKQEVDCCLDKFQLALDRLVEGSLEDSTQTDAQIQRFWRQYFSLRDRQNGQLQVAVLALAKSGKSTLLNALIGTTLLPHTNVPETARICKITHDAMSANSELTYQFQGETKKASGSAEIYKTLQALSSNVRTRSHRHAQADEQALQLRTSIAAVANVQPQGQGISLELLDTPGPNEAGEEHLRFEIERLLDSVDAVIYLLDYTKLKTQEEKELLVKLRTLNPRLFGRLSRRLFFVVNKVDQMGEKDLQEDETKQYVADLLNQQIEHPDFQLNPEQVLLVSAKDGLMARLQLQGGATKAETDDFNLMAFGRVSKAKAKSREEIMSAAREVLADSRLPELEATVFSFLCRHSGTLKLQATMDDLMQLIQQIKNVLAASKAALAQDMTQLQGQIGELQQRLEGVDRKFRRIEQDATNIEGEVSDLIQGRMQNLQERLFEHINAVLDAGEPSESPGAARGRTGRWRGVWQAAKAAFGQREPSTAGSDAAALHITLAELHASIQDSLNEEIAEFWHSLEEMASEQQVRLFARINRVLQQLAAEVDDTVGGLLSLRLEAVPLRLELPAQETMHASLQALITKGIQARVVSRTEEHQEHYTQPVYSGLCKMYRVHQPRTRTATREVQETHYEADADKVKAHFIDMVQKRVSVSERHVKTYVHKYVTEKVQQASKRIMEYGQQYQSAMTGALSSHREGEQARAAAADRADTRLAAFSQLLMDCSDLSERFPDRAADLSSALPAAHELPELAAARHADAAEQSDTEACHVVHPNEWSYGEPGLHIHGADEAPDMQPSTSSQAASSAAPGLAAPAPATGSGRRETVVTPSPQQLEQQLPMGAGPAQRARIEAGLQALSHHFDQSLQEASANEPAKPAAAAGAGTVDAVVRAVAPTDASVGSSASRGRGSNTAAHAPQDGNVDHSSASSSSTEAEAEWNMVGEEDAIEVFC